MILQNEGNHFNPPKKPIPNHFPCWCSPNHSALHAPASANSRHPLGVSIGDLVSRKSVWMENDRFVPAEYRSMKWNFQYIDMESFAPKGGWTIFHFNLLSSTLGYGCGSQKGYQKKKKMIPKKPGPRQKSFLSDTPANPIIPTNPISKPPPSRPCANWPSAPRPWASRAHRPST